MIDLILLYPLVLLSELFRGLLTRGRHVYILINLPMVQALLNRMGIIRAYRVYNRGRRDCPAYKSFLESQQSPRLIFGQSLDRLPVTTKENYVKKYSIEARCYGGEIPKRGTVIDESSGSSGTPNNWVRAYEDRADIKKLLQFSFSLSYENQNLFLVNCFALGPWATGMNVSMSLVDISILKSIGPDVEKLENTLRIFGPKYKYLIAGYPPFVKLFLDQSKLDLSAYEIHLVTGGEGMSEGLRDHFERHFKTVLSSYGASDLDINIAVETKFTVQLRKLCFQKPELAQKIFGQSRVPMIFQYNPLDFYIETSQNKELIYTVCRHHSAAPKVRYNLQDMGGTLKFKALKKILVEHGVDYKTLADRISALPLLFVYGRGDLAVPFYGSKVLSSDIDSVLHNTPALIKHFFSFKLSAFEDPKTLEHFLKITLQQKQNASPGDFSDNERADFQVMIFDELKKLNQDFREVSKMFSANKLILEIHPFQTGPFKDQDIRVKLNYVDKKN